MKRQRTTKSGKEAKAVAEMTAAEAAVSHAVVAAEIAENDRLYHREDAPKITDAEYDALRRELNAIEARFPKLKSAVSVSVGAPPSPKFAEARHAVPMLSLENAFSADDVRDFVGQMMRFLGRPADEPIQLTAEPKIDGLSMSLRYEQQRLVLGAIKHLINGDRPPIHAVDNLITKTPT